MDELQYTSAIHFAVKGRRQRRFYRRRELGLRLLTKSLVHSLLSIQASLYLRNFILQVLQQLHQLLYISRGLASHVNQYMHVTKGVTAT